MTFTINVTVDDIRNGTRKRCQVCPVALAIKRVMPSRRVSVTQDTIFIDDKPVYMPYEVGLFICRFDRGRRVSPFTFSLDLELPEAA